MTERTNHGPMSDPGQPVADQLVQVDRAAHELRRARPVMITGSPGGSVIATAAELVTEELVEQLKLRTGAAPDLAITHHRARTLKVRLYTDDVVLVPFPDWLTVETARGLSDPQTDLDFPLRGPFSARREPVALANVAGVQLAKIARLLPAVVTVPVTGSGVGGRAGFRRCGRFAGGARGSRAGLRDRRGPRAAPGHRRAGSHRGGGKHPHPRLPLARWRARALGHRHGRSAGGPAGC